jgi:pimeloyl-ACP methyl ester carboxylesterase
MSQLELTSLIPSKSTTVRLPLSVRAVGFALSLVDRIDRATASRIAARLFLTPRRVPRPASEDAWLATSRRETRLIAGLRLNVETWGEGKAVLLIHGWEGRGAQLGAFAARLAAEGFEVIAPDMPAHGSSGGKQTNLLEFAAVVGALIDQHDPVAIVAHSFGAAATNVALRSRDFNGRLIYVAPPEDFDFFTQSFGAILGISDDLAQRMQKEIERRFRIDWARLRGIAIAPEMTAPLLVAHDEGDTDVPYRFGRALVHAWPGARLLTTRGLGHRRILRDPAVIDAALEFISFNAKR